MRYLVALLVAVVIIAALKAFQSHIAAQFKQTLRQALRDAQAAGKPHVAGVDPDAADLTDFGIVVPSQVMTQIQIADVLANLWFVWMPLIVFGCLLTAWMTASKHTE